MATAVITTSSLTGPRKAAIALLSLDEGLASQVLAKMSLGDVKRLCEAVEDLGDVGGELIQLVLNDLERGLSDPLAMARASGPAYLRKLADKAFGSDRAKKALGIEAPNPEPLHQLRTARVRVLALMEQPIAADLTARISALEEIPEHAVTEASESLVRALEAVGGLASSDARAE